MPATGPLSFRARNDLNRDRKVAGADQAQGARSGRVDVEDPTANEGTGIGDHQVDGTVARRRPNPGPAGEVRSGRVRPVAVERAGAGDHLAGVVADLPGKRAYGQQRQE